MKQTEELVELIYWEPVIKPGSYAEQIAVTREASRKRNLTRRGRPKPGVMQEGDVETGMVSDRLDVPAVNEPGSRRARGVPWPEGADLATRYCDGNSLDIWS